jgi:hypothetical protein
MVPILSQTSKVNTVSSREKSFSILSYYPPIYTLDLQMVFCLNFPQQNPKLISILSHTCHMPRPSHAPSFHHFNIL